MSGRLVPLSKMRFKSSIWNCWMKKARQLTLPRLAVVVLASLVMAFSLSACENVASYTQPSLVRVIDASYIAPAIDVVVEGTTLAANIGEGYISPYGTLPANSAATVKITATTGDTALVTASATLKAGAQHSIFLTDNGAATNGYTVTVLEDQMIAAATSHSAFRFINEAPRIGYVDVYIIPASTTIANAIVQCQSLAVGATCGYLSFTSQTVTVEIVPAGTTTNAYVSASLALTGGEVRTVMIIDSQLTSDPAASAVIAADVN
jgi:hypothetical protein